MVGQDCFIMWTAFTNVSNQVYGTMRVGPGQKIERSSQTREQQAQGWGWPGINPTLSTSRLKTTYAKGQLAIKEACGDLKSGCKRTCDEAVADVLYNFPPPRDCIVEPNWGPWSQCSKSCGGGSQSRTRAILYPAKFGGKPCPPTTQYQACAQKPCLNPNFVE